MISLKEAKKQKWYKDLQKEYSGFNDEQFKFVLWWAINHEKSSDPQDICYLFKEVSKICEIFHGLAGD